MKKLFTAFVLLFMAVAPLVAQTVPEKSINIIASSLRPVQTDALTGVNIDPIQTDMSNRTCARIKMRVNRMTKAEIGQLEIKIIGGNAQVVRQMVADDGNGLIFEVTARENLRFYIQHPEFGESNDVQLAVVGNKEYYLDAELNQLFTIVVASNTADAEIYIDEKFVGRTQKMGADFLCTIKDVLPGEHKLYLKYGHIVSDGQVINVNSVRGIYFRQDVNISKNITLQSQTSAPYKVGDYYNENGKEGVVFEVDATGRHGKIVALTESPKVLQWCTKAEYVSRAKKGSTTTSATDGAYNMSEIKKIYGWQEGYPAFAYCASLGDGWYLPAKEELEKLMLNSSVYNAVNKTLQSQNKPRLNKGKYYWSSTQNRKYPAISWCYYATGLMHYYGKNSSYTVRAVSAF